MPCPLCYPSGLYLFSINRYYLGVGGWLGHIQKRSGLIPGSGFGISPEGL